MYGKSNKQTYITICKRDIQQELAVWLMKLTQGLCINLKGWDLREMGLLGAWLSGGALLLPRESHRLAGVVG